MESPEARKKAAELHKLAMEAAGEREEEEQEHEENEGDIDDNGANSDEDESDDGEEERYDSFICHDMFRCMSLNNCILMFVHFQGGRRYKGNHSG